MGYSYNYMMETGKNGGEGQDIAPSLKLTFMLA